jgi:hypothetical protein
MTHAWKPIASMTREERSEYNRLRAQDSRKKKKLAEELAEEKKRLEQQEAQQQVVKPEEKELDDVPVKWTQAFDSFLDQDTAVDKITRELNRAWLYSHDIELIQDLQRFIFAVENKYIQLDEYCRVLGVFPDVLLVDTIRSLQTRPHFNTESDALDLRKSPTFTALYADALWKANSLNDPKYTSLMDVRMWGTVKSEFQRVCQD